MPVFVPVVGEPDAGEPVVGTPVAPVGSIELLLDNCVSAEMSGKVEIPVASNSTVDMAWRKSPATCFKTARANCVFSALA